MKVFLLERFVERFLVSKNKIGYLSLTNGSVFMDGSYNSRSLKDFYNKCTKKERNDLLEMGFILNQSEEQFVENHLWNLKKLKENLNPSAIVFVLGFECNFNCPYCTPENYKKKYGNRSIPITELELDLTKAFKMISDKYFLRKGVTKLVTFYGGEPFLNFTTRHKQIKYIFKKLVKLKTKHFFTPTNGYNLNYFKDDLKILTKNNIDVTLQITLDGPPKIHNLTRRRFDGKDTFYKIVKNIDDILKSNNKIKFKIRTNISPSNKNYLKDYIRYLQKNQKNWINNPLIEFSFIPLFNSTLSNKDQDNISDSELYSFFIWLHEKGIKNYKSHTILNFLIDSLNGSVKLKPTIRCKDIVFGPDGKIYHCVLCDKKTLIGDLEGMNFNKEKLNKDWKGQKYNIPKCKDCKYVFICDGGDRLMAMKIKKSSIAPMCECYRKNFAFFYQILLNPKKYFKRKKNIAKINFINPCSNCKQRVLKK